MEEVSMISHTKLAEESSESANFPVSKRPKSTERFKGVVPQQTGHWGAQIYANHHRIWLGTFKSEASAAMAYDSAAMKLRSGDSRRNFPPTVLAPLELKFQSGLTTDSVLNMIRDGSYSTKFSDFLASQKKQGDEKLGLGFQLGLGFDSASDGNGEFSSTLLFQKELTPSDVGKLNRLVIPKRYAVKYFPGVPEEEQVQLEFYDRAMRVWKFRYCYWKSSQSFVFTRGWSRFVKAKGLRSNDSVAFYLYESRRLGRRFTVIDVAEKDGDFGEVVEEKEEEAKETLLCSSPSSNGTKVSFRLFGIEISNYV